MTGFRNIFWLEGKKKVAGESISKLMCPIAIGPLSKASATFYLLTHEAVIFIAYILGAFNCIPKALEL